MTDDTKTAAETPTQSAEQETAGTTATTKPARQQKKRAPVAGKPSVKTKPATPEKPAARKVLDKPSAPAKTKAKAAKSKKIKLVRDSFTMPEMEYAEIAAVKKRCLKAGVAVKKSEVLRAAVLAFAKLSDTRIVAAIGALTPIKTGRPAKEDK